MIDKKIQPDYSTKEEKLRLHAALPLLAPAIATAIGAALGLTGTGLVLQKKIQNYFANNPGALDSIVSKFGTKPGDQPEVEKELKELTKPTTTPIKTWEKSFADTGTKVPEKLPESKGIEVPPQEKVSPPGFQKAEPLGIDILTKDIADETVPKESEDKIKKANNDLENKATYKFQYMADKEGGQTIGNREIILKLDKEIFNKYVKKLSNIKTFEKHEKEFPNTYVRFFKRGDLPEYRITKVGQLGEEIVPEVIEDSIYNIKVKDFNSKKAIKHSKTFDSDVYPIEKAMGGIIDKPLTGNSRYI